MRPSTVEMPWGRQRVWRHGTGPVILAVHGLGGSGRYWDGLAELVGDRHTLIAPDLAGFGRSAKPKLTYDRALHLDTLDRLAAGLGPVVVVGHSLGGVLAVLWAGANAERVTGLSLNATPWPTPRPDWDPSSWTGPRAKLAVGIATGARLAWPLLSLPAQVLSPYPWAVVRDYGRQSVRGRAWTLWSLWGDPAMTPSMGPATAALAGTPALLLHADDDRTVRPDNLRHWAEALPGALARTVPTGGHQFLLRQRFAPVVDWLGTLGSVAPPTLDA